MFDLAWFFSTRLKNIYLSKLDHEYHDLPIFGVKIPNKMFETNTHVWFLAPKNIGFAKVFCSTKRV